MHVCTFIRSFFVAFVLLIQAVSAHSDSLSELFSAVPRPPADIDTALTWVKDGEIVEPGILAFEATLATQKEAVATLSGGEAGAGGSAGLQSVSQSLSRYLANNAGEDSPEAALTKRKRWLQRAYGQEQLEISQAMTPCVSPCTDKAIYEGNIPYLRQRQSVLKLEIRSWNALFDDWKKTRRRGIVAADTVLEPVDPAGVGEGEQATIARYRALMLKEVELLFSITKLSVLRIEAIMKGLDGSEPDAISGATKKAG